MKLIKSIFKYIGFFILGIVTCAFVGATVASYYAVDQLAKATAPQEADEKIPVANASLIPLLESSVQAASINNPNFKEAIRIGSRNIDIFSSFDDFIATVGTPSRSLCSTVCNPSRLDKERLNTDGVAYLIEFYEQERSRAFEDPLFRLRYEEIRFLSQLVPTSLRKVVARIDQSHNQEKLNRLALALQLEFAVAQEATGFYMRAESYKQEDRKLKDLRDLVESCQHGAPHKKVISECHSQWENGI